MPFQTNCPSCGKNMLMRESMFGKPKRCSHCDKLFRVGGGPVPTEAEFSAFEAEAAAAPSKTATATKAKPRQIVVTKEGGRRRDSVARRPARPNRSPSTAPPEEGRGAALAHFALYRDVDRGSGCRRLLHLEGGR